jgi:hypothetical protein
MFNEMKWNKLPSFDVSGWGKKGASAMPFPRGVIDNDHLNIMQRAMDLSCQQLAIREADAVGRERVAFLVTGFMRAGEHDPDKLTKFVIGQFKLSS